MPDRLDAIPPRALPPAWPALLAVLLVGAGCVDPSDRHPHPTDELHFPGHLATSPDGKYLFVVGTNFDLRYDGAAVLTIDLETHRFVTDAAVQIGSFPGQLAVRETADGAMGYVADRETGHLNWFRIDTSGDTAALDCGGKVNSRTGVEVCGDDFRVRSAEVDDVTIEIGDDPFGLGFNLPAEGAPAFLFVGSLRDGTLSVLRLDEQGVPTLIEACKVVQGLYGIATSPSTGLTYVASQFAQGIYTVLTTDQADGSAPEHLMEPNPAYECRSETTTPVLEIDAFTVSNVNLGSSLGQTLAFNASGTLAFETFRAPAGLVVVDTAPDALGAPRNEVIAWIEVGRSPAEMAVVPKDDGPGELVYVVCFGSNDIYVVDTATMGVVDVIETGLGPFDIEVVSRPDLGWTRAYVSLFEKDRIAVIDLDRASPFYHQVIAEIR
jgi:YVTN family beta-propeller protein